MHNSTKIFSSYDLRRIVLEFMRALVLVVLSGAFLFQGSQLARADWYDDLLKQDVSTALAIEKAATIAADRVKYADTDVDSWQKRVPKGESCNETAFDLGQAIISDSAFQAYTGNQGQGGWEVHTVYGHIGGPLAHTTTVIVPPKPQGWQQGQPYPCYCVDNYSGLVAVEPMEASWKTGSSYNNEYSGYVYKFKTNPGMGSGSTTFALFNLFGQGNELELKQHRQDKALNVKYELNTETDKFEWKTIRDQAVQTNPYSQFSKNDSAPTQKEDSQVSVRQSMDPNEKTGPTGFGQFHAVRGDQPLAYTVFFENEKKYDTNGNQLTIPAQTVVITDILETYNLETSTFQFGVISVLGKEVIPVAVPMTKYEGHIDLRPDSNVVVRVVGSLVEGTVTWTFISLDPAGWGNGYIDMQPFDPSAFDGFLPAGGTGSVSFSILPRADLASETFISNAATIKFDTNASMSTNIWENTIDKIPPESHVLILATVQRPISKSFEVKWTGSDSGADIGGYSLFFSEDGGPYQLRISKTSSNSVVFKGGKLGSTYRLFSVATDNVGNLEDTPDAPDATTRLLPSGDIDGDGDVDKNDLNVVMANRNKTVAQSTCGPAGDLDWDGKITVLDARILVTQFTRPGGAVQ